MQFDILLLCETVLRRSLKQLLAEYDVFETLSQNGKLGSGLLVAVRRHHAYYTVLAHQTNDFCIVHICSTQHKVILSVCVCYIPPEGSKQLQGPMHDLHARYAMLQQACGTAISKGPFLVTGDFNADLNTPSRRAQHVHALTTFCNDLNLLFCDTLQPHSSSPLPSYFPAHPRDPSRTPAAPSRLDHCLISAPHSSLILNSAPFPKRPDSDHAPLFTDMRVELDSGLEICRGRVLPRVYFDSAAKEGYGTFLQARDLDALAQSGESIDARCTQLTDMVIAAAREAGMKVRKGGRATQRAAQQRRVHAQWYDPGCARLKKQMHYCKHSRDREGAARAERAHHSRRALNM